MDTIRYERKFIDELTTLEKALRVYNKEEFFATKKKILGPEFDEKAQRKIWQEYHDLMNKAIHRRGFDEVDLKRLKYYRTLEGHFDILATESQLSFPTELIRDSSGQIFRVNLDFLDNEITRRWFDHVYHISITAPDIRTCQAENCSMLFIRRGRKDKKFCSDQCRLREWRKQQKNAYST